VQVPADQRRERCQPGRKHVLLVVDDGAVVLAERREDEAAFDGGLSAGDVGGSAVKTSIVELVLEPTRPGTPAKRPRTS